MTLAASLAEDRNSAGALRRPLGDVMQYEVLINEKSRVWIFHDKPLQNRLAWVEFDPETGAIELVPHDMRSGILYADISPALHARIQTSDLVYFYLTDGEKVTGFQKVPFHTKRY